MKERFAKLSWFILECKYCYYCRPQFKHPSDTEYDKVEEEYKAIAAQLGVEPSASNMVGFDLNRPSCRLVAEAVNAKKGLTICIDWDILIVTKEF